MLVERGYAHVGAPVCLGDLVRARLLRDVVRCGLVALSTLARGARRGRIEPLQRRDDIPLASVSARVEQRELVLGCGGAARRGPLKPGECLRTTALDAQAIEQRRGQRLLLGAALLDGLGAQGLDARELTAELRQKLGYPKGLEGALVGEVTLGAARAGLLGGDVIVAVADQPVTTLASFQEATRTAANSRQAAVAVLRKTPTREPTGNRYAVVRLTLMVVADRELGFAQAEGAPMIKPGDPRPHAVRGPCTHCHTVGTGFELRPDPDLISLPPPVIPQRLAASGSRPHEDRGPCEACHVIAP